MTKLTRDARAFARRVGMGSARVWLIVEGRNSDRPLYGRLLAAAATPTTSYEVRLAEQISLHGDSAGGKAFALKLHDYFEGEGLLQQSTNNGRRAIAFALDRDLDHLTGAMRHSNSIYYTEHADAEAEILLNGDCRRAIASAFSIDEGLVNLAIPPHENFAETLGLHWRDWVAMGAVAAACRVQVSTRFSLTSRIHADSFGSPLKSEHSRISRDLQRRIDAAGCQSVAEHVTRGIDVVFAASESRYLLKGRWLAQYVEHRVRTALASRVPLDSAAAHQSLPKTCLETLDFNASWTHPFRSFLDDLASAA